MKILFFGTPRFAEIVFDKLQKSSHKIVGLVCREDKMSGRGMSKKTAHIVEMAKNAQIPVFQFEKLGEHVQDFLASGADVAVTASYGKIIPKSVLDALNVVNVHPSLLPKFRGATPIQTALLSGEKTTGVSIIKTGVGLDDGDVYAQKIVQILPEEDYFSLHDRLAEIGAQLLLETLEKIENGTAKLTPQKGEVTFCKLIQKEDARLCFLEDAASLVCKVRAFAQSPVAFFTILGARIKVHKACVASEKTDAPAGTILSTKKRFLIAAKDGSVFEILSCQGEGGKVLPASAFLNGFRFPAMVVDA